MTNSLFYNLTCASFEHPTNSSTFPVPEPYIREPTDFIPDSEDTSAATSREVTQANNSQNNGTAEETKTQQQPKVVSLVCRAHEGQLSAAPYSIKPTQLVSLKYLIPGRVALSVKCLATDESLIADPGVPSSFPARSHTFGWFCCFTSQVNSYGHCGMVSSPYHTFSWAGLNKRLTSNLCTYFRFR